MRIRSALPHITFLVGFIVLAVGSAGLADVLEQPDWTASLLTYGLAVPVTLLVALRIGAIGYRGILVTSIATAALVVGLALALWTGLYSASASTFPWSAAVAIDVALCIFSPVAWLYVIRRVSSNNSFKGMPLRGTP